MSMIMSVARNASMAMFMMVMMVMMIMVMMMVHSLTLGMNRFGVQRCCCLNDNSFAQITGTRDGFGIDRCWLRGCRWHWPFIESSSRLHLSSFILLVIFNDVTDKSKESRDVNRHNTHTDTYTHSKEEQM
ncbi:hypothetical protein CLU79DRAFT_724374 [Phycomyces nitens]|nr:hypothetical protein CLU79DRAFT_724374 [Phycomyces nitens]